MEKQPERMSPLEPRSELQAGPSYSGPRYVEGANFDNVDYGLTGMLNGLTISSSNSVRYPFHTDTLKPSSDDDRLSRLNLSQWSDLTSATSPEHSLRVGSVNRSTPVAHNKQEMGNTFTFNNYYDNNRDMQVKDLENQSADATKSFTWDMIWTSPKLKKYVRQQPASTCATSLPSFTDHMHYPVPEVTGARDLAFLNGKYIKPPRISAPFITEEAFKEFTKSSVPKVPQTKAVNSQNIHARTSLCKFWQRGTCSRENCNFAHGVHELQSTVGVWKTTICYHWKQGNCRNGANCRHAHGEEERQPRNYHMTMKSRKPQNVQYRMDMTKRKAPTPEAIYESYIKWYAIIKQRMDNIRTEEETEH